LGLNCKYFVLFNSGFSSNAEDQVFCTKEIKDQFINFNGALDE